MKNYDKQFALLAGIPYFQGKEITDFCPSKLGMTNDSYLFCCEGIRYILRIPGRGTDQLLNRHQEKEVYDQLIPAGFAQDVLYFDENSGIKVSRFMEGSHVCDPHNSQEVKRCFEALKKLHQQKLSVNHHFDLWQEIEKYEAYRQGKDSIHADYSSLKEVMRKLYLFTQQVRKETCLCHIDAVSDNFLIQGDKVHLIDWEYAAMQDPDIDVVMFLIYSTYDANQIDDYLSFFLADNDTERRYKCYAYIALTGFLWSSWCEYKMLEGICFGEYLQRQYSYAKEYAEKVSNYLWPK